MQPIGNATELTAAATRPQLRECYAYPDDLRAPWIRVNAVSGIDGGVTLADTSTGLGTPADRAVFTVMRELADVIVVGAGTVRAENYGGVHLDPDVREWRVTHGMAPLPVLAVVSATAALDPRSRLFIDAEQPLIVLTGSAAARDRIERLRAAAEVVSLDAATLSADAIVGALAGRGLVRVLCEGGPHLVGCLLDGQRVDEVCLTTAPVLIGGSGARMTAGSSTVAIPMQRAHLLAAEDGTVLTRWVRRTDRHQP